MNPHIHIAPSFEELSLAAAVYVTHITRAILTKKRRIFFALSGGTTPLGMYQILSEQYKTHIDWNRILFFWSDERHVPLSHPENNSKTALDSLLKPLKVKEENIFRVNTNLAPLQAAYDYEKTILAQTEYPAGRIPGFDVLFLGLGQDGHTASLFPGTSALEESKKLVTANWIASLKSWRITFTFPLINHADHIIFLVTGKDKAKTVQRIFMHDPSFPASHVEADHGTVAWFLDAAAATQISNIE